MNSIPDIVNPSGANWQQPNREDLLIDDTHVIMEELQFKKLLEYSHSLPSGMYAGKMWKHQTMDGEWWLCWYRDIEDKTRIGIEQRQIIIL